MFNEIDSIKGSLAHMKEDSLNPKQLNHLENNNGWWIAHYVASDSTHIYCPIPGEIIKIDKYTFKIDSADNRKIKIIKLKIDD